MYVYPNESINASISKPISNPIGVISSNNSVNSTSQLPKTAVLPLRRFQPQTIRSVAVTRGVPNPDAHQRRKGFEAHHHIIYIQHSLPEIWTQLANI